MNTKRPTITRARFGALGAAFACAPSVAGAQNLSAISVATIPIDNGAEVFYAQDRGFFAKAGLSVDIRTLSNGSAIVAAVASNSIDIGFSNLFPVVTAFSKGIPVVAIAPAALYDSASPADVLLVRKDSMIHTGKDLNGKTIAVNGVKAVAQITAAAWIDEHGGDSSTVKWLEMPDLLMSDALTDRRIDAANAAMSDNPYAGTAQSEVRILGYPFDVIGKHFLASVWFASKAWADAHPSLVAKFSDAIVQSGRWANANQTDSARILAKYLKLTPKRAEALKRNRAPYDEHPLEASAMAKLIAVAAKYGLITKPFPPSDLVRAAR